MLKGTRNTPDYGGVPTTVFTIPELARVGLLEDEARSSGIEVEVRYTDTSGWYSNYRIGEPTAAAKILIDKSNDTIIGAHMLGPEYGELRSEEHTSELQSLMRISYAVFCLKKKKHKIKLHQDETPHVATTHIII